MILTTKLRSLLKKIESGLELEFYLKNENINGMRVGCSGFVKNTENNKIVYVSTVKNCYEPLSKKNLIRVAKSLKDFSGERNQFATDEELASKIVELLR